MVWCFFKAQTDRKFVERIGGKGILKNIQVLKSKGRWMKQFGEKLQEKIAKIYNFLKGYTLTIN